MPLNLLKGWAVSRRRNGVKACMSALLALALGVALTPVGPQKAQAQAGAPGDDRPAAGSKLSKSSLLLAVTRAGTRLVAVGHWGHVVLSDDNGVTWTQAKEVPTQSTLTDVSFADPQNGWAVGHDAIILNTTDGGQTWTRQMVDFELGGPLLTVHALDATKVIAAGAFGQIYESADAGKTWEPRRAAEKSDFHLNEIFNGPNGTLWIAGESGHMYKSTDGGKSFAELVTPYDGSFWSGMALADGTVLAMGMRGNIWTTKDLGTTWTQVPTDVEQSISGGTVAKDGTITLVGLAGLVLTSKDGANSFTAQLRKERDALSAVMEGANGELLSFGEKGVTVLRAEDLEAKS